MKNLEATEVPGRERCTLLSSGRPVVKGDNRQASYKELPTRTSQRCGVWVCRASEGQADPNSQEARWSGTTCYGPGEGAWGSSNVSGRTNEPL